MALNKLTPLLVVDEIERAIKPWSKLGYTVTVRVPEKGPAGFVILSSPSGELMLQTKASLADDLPLVAAREPELLLYADVSSLSVAKKGFPKSEVLVAGRETFYGAREAWLALESGAILGLAEHS